MSLGQSLFGEETRKRRRRRRKEKELKIEENGKKMKEQRTGARRVSSRLESSQVLYERGNYRGRRGETGGGRRRETGGEEGGKRESGRRERERERHTIV